MPLVLLKNLTFPLDPSHTDELLHNAMQFSILSKGVTERQQRALGLHFEIYALLARSKGTLDYTERAGHERLKTDAMAVMGGGNPIFTRHGDLAAAHLAIDWHNAQCRLKKAGLPLLADDTDALLVGCKDLVELPEKIEERLDMYLRWSRRASV